MSSQSTASGLFQNCDSQLLSSTASTAIIAANAQCVSNSPVQNATLSRFEAIMTTYPPILESFLSQIPTTAILDLYHTSKHLRNFLQSYPLAWKTLSFRLSQPAGVLGTPGNETPDSRERQSKAYALDFLLKQVVQPHGTRLTSLDLCNTAVSGIALVSSVLTPRIDTLQHLSVRGCKNVSIKYHIVPFLEPYTQKDSPWTRKDLALKSLYTYRCRHHRRRPYLPSSLLRRDSDTDPTHQLIEICHQLAIWTDTAWCPTPGGRCFRRKEYHQGRPGNMEVWVPFDRLWRSSNRIGPTSDTVKIGSADGRLWEISETGQDGEPLGTEDGTFKGEGKHVPAHLRQSHKTFVDDFKCTQCSDIILERCESCSVRMHCMGCRKTLCASCAFNRPIPRKKAKTRNFASLAFGAGAGIGHLSHASPSSSTINSVDQASKDPPADRFWWAPGATRSPNLMNEITNDDDGSESEDGFNNGPPVQPPPPPKLNMSWCCLEPIFSGGGGIAVLGTGLGGKGADKIRAAPLPQEKQFVDPDFVNQLRPVDYIRELKNNGLYEYVLGEDVDILSYLKQDSLDLQAQTCPRGLCQDCYRSFRWKVSCRGCKKSLCKEHDFRALKFRKCGFRDLNVEREHVRTHNEPARLVIPAFKSEKLNGNNNPPHPISDAASSPSHQSPSNASIADAELPEPAPLSQSQILLSPSASTTSVNQPASTIHPSHGSPSPFANLTISTPFVPVSSSRPRSLSASGASGARKGNLGSWTNSASRNITPLPDIAPPLPCNPRHPVQWEGCGAYFCQSPRPVGDIRPRCPYMLRECTACQVLVCDACLNANPRCSCTFCTLQYHCPHCSRKKEVRAQCRYEEELKAKEEAEVRAKERMEKEKESREQADQLAENVSEFWMGLIGEDMGSVTEASGGESDELKCSNINSSGADSPTDKITVTTEFGVAHEPSNVTVISAAGPSCTVQQNSTEEPQQHSNSVSSATASGNLPTNMDEIVQEIMGLVSGHEQEEHHGEIEEDESGEDNDQDDEEEDEDDADAESAFIDEFLDPMDLGPN